MRKIKIVFFTGAGVSAESGLETFRDSENGLWNNFRIEDVCSPLAWSNNPRLVLDFYNERRRQYLSVQPNKAHDLIAALESDFEVTVVTQNVDDLHERAGSTKVIHLHGEITKVRSTVDKELIYKTNKAVVLGDLCEKGSQLRPHVVWFGEELNKQLVHEAMVELLECDICVVIGTSLEVYPANTLPILLNENCKLIVINPDETMDSNAFSRDFYFIQETASMGMRLFYDSVLRNQVENELMQYNMDLDINLL